MREKLSSLWLKFVLTAGILLLLYPAVSDYWNSFHQTRAVANYEENITEADTSVMDEMWLRAEEYNKTLISKADRFSLSEEEEREYGEILDISGTGIIGTLEIPEIQVKLPIYHGVDEGVLQVAVGHIEGTSFPVGGEGTHAVLSGHRGLPSARLLTDLDRMSEGDLFMIRVLNRVMTYSVDQIRIVEPDDVGELKIEKDRDYCTLVTCTPYGVNSHRLLVRGHRAEDREIEEVRVTTDAFQIEPLLVAAVIAAFILLILLIWLLFSTRDGKKDRKDGEGL